MDQLPARVRAFVLGSATSANNAESLRSFYATLSIEGWIVELARAHGRALLGAWSHAEFAAWIGLRGEELGVAYRRMLKLGEQDREELVQLARRILNLRTDNGIPLLQKSGEMQRFRRAREVVERRASTMGRPRSVIDVVGPLGRQLERWRLELRLSVDDWAAGLGVAGLTYRARIEKENAGGAWRAKIDELVKMGAQRHAALCAPLVARHPVVTPKELAAAYSIVANDLEDLRAELLRDTAPSSLMGNECTGEDSYLPLDLYSWLRDPQQEEQEETTT